MPTPLTRHLHGPLEHHEAFVHTSCSCRYCQEWRQARHDTENVAARIAKTPCSCAACRVGVASTTWPHSYACVCPLCVEARGANERLLAAQNRNDLWSEMSYHATHDPVLSRQHLGPHLMDWLEWEMGRRQDTRWWALAAARASIGEWIDKFEKVWLTVSGAVFLPVKAE